MGRAKFRKEDQVKRKGHGQEMGEERREKQRGTSIFLIVAVHAARLLPLLRYTRLLIKRLDFSQGEEEGEKKVKKKN